MSYFSAALDALIREHKLTQAELALRVGVKQSQISNYLAERNRPDPETVARFAAAFEKGGTRLVADYLKDQVPEAYLSKVSIALNDGAKPASTDPARYQRLRPAARKIVDEIIDRAEKSPQFLAHLESMLKLIRLNEE
jgi:transcriptional regulator with XRE-family HTH domain